MRAKLAKRIKKEARKVSPFAPDSVLIAEGTFSIQQRKPRELDERCAKKVARQLRRVFQ